MLLRSYSPTTHIHSHDYCQWVFPLLGELEIEISGKGDIVRANTGAFIPPEANHAFSSVDNNLFLVLDMQPLSPWLSNGAIPCFWELSPTIQHYLKFAQSYLQQQSSNPTSILLVTDFLEKLLTQHFLSKTDRRIVAVKSWIDTHYANAIHLSSLANLACLSASQLQRRFKRSLGCTVSEYWRKVRLEKSRQLLCQGRHSIESIAHQVGFESAAAFSRSFRQAYSTSPLEWLKTQVI